MLERATPLYADLVLALRVFQMRYPVFIAETTPAERRLYRTFLALENAKKEHAIEKQQRMGEARQDAHVAAGLTRRRVRT